MTDDSKPEAPARPQRTPAWQWAMVAAALAGLIGSVVLIQVWLAPSAVLGRALNDTYRTPSGAVRITAQGSDLAAVLAWSPAANQLTVERVGRPVAQITATGRVLYLRLQPGEPAAAAFSARVRAVADTYGPAGAALRGLAGGETVAVNVEPGSPMEALLKRAQAGNQEAAALGALNRSPVQRGADALWAQALRSSSVESDGRDETGQLFHVATSAPAVRSLLEALAGSALPLPQLEGRVTSDVWVSDGRVVRLVVHLTGGAAGQKVTVEPTSSPVAVPQTATVVPDRVLEQFLSTD